jgi:hypothetical protein
VIVEIRKKSSKAFPLPDVTKNTCYQTVTRAILTLVSMSPKGDPPNITVRATKRLSVKWDCEVERQRQQIWKRENREEPEDNVHWYVGIGGEKGAAVL